ncbi:MAG: thioredoxin family protein [Flavobacteriales bacterium]|nr:thioredoxin family protein [Flavobacteriales bacterium]
MLGLENLHNPGVKPNEAAGRIQFFLFLLFFLFHPSQAKALQRTAKDSSNSITLYIFSGSDWCPNCLKLKQRVLDKENFQKKLQDSGIRIVVLDFPQKRKQDPEVVKFNRLMAEKFGFDGGFPTLVLYEPVKNTYIKFLYHNEDEESFHKLILNELNVLYE